MMFLKVGMIRRWVPPPYLTLFLPCCPSSFSDTFTLRLHHQFCVFQVGVASIGEVHKAVLKGTKEVVAVKILVPNIEHKFRADIRTLKSFCQIAMPQVCILFFFSSVTLYNRKHMIPLVIYTFFIYSFHSMLLPSMRSKNNS